ncbi:glycoside hydrolase family 57 protein [Ktedonospora formicarum]|uniref:Alpha-amylase n=1 Tax=Ktedonospora formicarum TaxID=2778364 RepID=A0A8J3MRR8_9CHLR|nr:glycoside hydrolase family 57 protein [Ktedonospora formicarum]GHO43873.1 alpha-amylase [Ktedonospora formicarum]
MVADVALYTIVHQPRRLKLPAQPIPRGASLDDIAHCLFDEALNERYFRQVAQSCYYPATKMFLDLARRGLRLSIGFSFSLLQQVQTWEPELLDLFRELVAEERVELLGVEPYQSLLFLFDLPAFEANMRKMADDMAELFGKRPRIVGTTELGMSAPLYNALDAAGFQGVLMDSQPHLLGWRESTYLYHYGDDGPYVRPLATRRQRSKEERSLTAPLIYTRHRRLSDDISSRFTDLHWSDFPLYATTYASWIANTPGDQVVLGWDFETFGERHSAGSGIFDFMRALPGELENLGVRTHTLSELGTRPEVSSYYLPLPITPALQGGTFDPDASSDYLATASQRHLLRSMNDVYNTARLTEQPVFIEMARWLTQVDHLRYAYPHVASSPFIPREWWRLGPSGVVYEQQQAYDNVLRAMEPYLPARALRRLKPRVSRRSTDVSADEPITEPQAVSFSTRRRKKVSASS